VSAGKSGLRLLVDMIEQDFANIGAGMLNPNLTAADAAVTLRGSESGYQVFRFRGLPSPTATATAVITYRWRADGTATLADGTTVTTLLVERLVDGTVTGSSFDNVTTFDIDLREDDLEPFDPATGDYDDIRYVDVDIAMVSPLGTDGIVEQTRWAKQFRPINLSPESRTLLRVVLPVP
jgi:hypothetical protein